METNVRRRLAIIGAGPSGLSLLHAFCQHQTAGDGTIQLEIVCFEKQNDWGGLWNYTWRTGLDEYGEPVHSSLYRHLLIKYIELSFIQLYIHNRLI